MFVGNIVGNDLLRKHLSDAMYMTYDVNTTPTLSDTFSSIHIQHHPATTYADVSEHDKNYVCSHFSCQEPVNDPARLDAQLTELGSVT